MPNITKSTAVLHLAAILVALLAASGAAAQTLTLTVPFRFAASSQTVSTTIEFDASIVNPGATIAVSRTLPAPGPVETVIVPASGSVCGGSACPTTPASTFNDDIVVTRIDANRVQLQLTYLESFGANYCAYTGTNGTKAYNVTLSNFGFAGPTNGYRMTSFMTPSLQSCDIPYVRVPPPRPALAGAVNRLGRLPLNVVLVLDKSPSMGWTMPASADIRWDAFRGAAQLFTNVWDVIGAPPPPGTVSSEGHAQDRLGLIFFGGTAAESPLDGMSFFKARGGGPNPWGGTVSAALPPAPVFIGGTSIGAGTDNGRSRLNGLPNKVQGDSAILLFTDGEQNRPPCIIHQGETTTPTTKPYPGIPGQTYVDQCTVAAGLPGTPLTLNGTLLAKNVLPRGPIFTIGLGEGATAESALLLDQIAQETAGQARYPMNSAALTAAFINTLVDNLKGGTVSTLEDTQGTVAAGDPASSPMTVAVDPSLTRVVFVLAWKGIGREVALEIRRPDGTVVTPTLRENSATSRVVGVNVPADGPSGNWQARLVGQGGTPGPLEYQLAAYGVESRLSSRVTESRQLGTGREIRVVAEVGWGDDGLPDLPAGAIIATIERPDANAGNLLGATLVGDPAPAQADASPLMVKFHRLAASSGFLDRIEPRPVATIPLVSVGNGRYEGTFDGTNVGGRYRIRLAYDWTDPRTGAIRRRHVAERQVPVIPSAADSVVRVLREPRATTALIVVTPRDRFSNQVGPGFEGQFNARVAGASVERVNDPDLTGAYSIRVNGIAPDDDPRVTIDYGGQTLFDAPISQIATGAGGRRAVWLAFGSTYPQGSFSNNYDRDIAVNAAFEYGLGNNWAVEATIGRHEFEGKNGAPNLDAMQYGLNAKYYFAMPNWRPFLTAGVGAYDFDPGSTQFGGSLGLGAQFDINPQWAVEGRYAYHWISGNSPNSRYSTLLLGLRFAF